MLTDINPKLPMRNKAVTKDFYVNQLGFRDIGATDYDGYLMVKKDNIEIHFFEFATLNPKENYGQVYIRTNDIEKLYQSMTDNKLSIHPAGTFKQNPGGKKSLPCLTRTIIYLHLDRPCKLTNAGKRRTAALHIAKKPSNDTHFFCKQSGFRKWLKKIIQKKLTWCWLYKLGSGKPSITWPQSVDEALCFGWIDGVRTSIDKESYRFALRNGKPPAYGATLILKK